MEGLCLSNRKRSLRKIVLPKRYREEEEPIVAQPRKRVRRIPNVVAISPVVYVEKLKERLNKAVGLCYHHARAECKVVERFLPCEVFFALFGGFFTRAVMEQQGVKKKVIVRANELEYLFGSKWDIVVKSLGDSETVV